MDYLLLILGILIVLLTIGDILYTTFVPAGSGFMTKILTRGTWRFFMLLGSYQGRSKVITYCGAVTMVFTFSAWIFLYWLGNFLIFLAFDNSVVDANTEEPAGFWDKAYYTGYVISTMGNGDFKPLAGIYQVYSSALSFSGLALITSSLTYFIPVLQADNYKRTVSNYINVLGETPFDILNAAWNGEDFKSLNRPLETLNDRILELHQKYIDYPIITNFHNTLPKRSISVGLAILDETISLLLTAVPYDKRPSEHLIFQIRMTIAKLLQTLEEEFIQPVDEVPVLPDPNLITLHNLKINPDINEAFDKLSIRRRLVLAYVWDEGWDWEKVYSIAPKNELEKSSFIFK